MSFPATPVSTSLPGPPISTLASVFPVNVSPRLPPVTFSIAEAEASHDLSEGDLLCGRLYPLGDERYRLSPAMAVFRDPALAQALESDLERLRSRRRGTLRIAQGELERMFFAAPQAAGTGGSDAPAPNAPAPNAPAAAALAPVAEPAARQVRAELLELLGAGGGAGQAGLGPERAAALLEAFEVEARRGERASAAGALGELLDAVAFHSQVDIERVRRLCIEHWNALLAEPAGAPPGRPAAPWSASAKASSIPRGSGMPCRSSPVTASCSRAMPVSPSRWVTTSCS